MRLFDVSSLRARCRATNPGVHDRFSSCFGAFLTQLSRVTLASETLLEWEVVVTDDAGILAVALALNVVVYLGCALQLKLLRLCFAIAAPIKPVPRG